VEHKIFGSRPIIAHQDVTGDRVTSSPLEPQADLVQSGEAADWGVAVAFRNWPNARWKDEAGGQHLGDCSLDFI
jgi:hypothetical protein